MKSAEAWQKLVELRRESGTPLQVMIITSSSLTRSQPVVQLFDALSLILPQSTLYPVLASLPSPDPTNPTLTTTYAAQTAIHNSLPIFEQLIALLETHEDQYLEKEVEKRRTRLKSSPMDQLRKEVGMEIWGTSRVRAIDCILQVLILNLRLQLPELYNEVLMHPSTGDALRRQTESKLLRYKQRYLEALPEGAAAKSAILRELDELVNGAVLLGIPDEFAWMIFLEAQDCETIGQLRLSIDLKWLIPA